MRFGELLEVGLENSPTTYIPDFTPINGNSTQLGDGDSSSIINASILTGEVGFHYSSSNSRQERVHQVVRQQVKTQEVAGHEIVDAVKKWYITGITWDGGWAGDQQVGVYLVKKLVDPAMTTTEVTWLNYDTSASGAWAAPGGKSGVDYEATPVAILTVVQDDYEAVNGGGYDSNTPWPLGTVQIIEPWLRSARGALANFYLMLRPLWARPATATHSQFVKFQDSQANATKPHAYTDVTKRKPLSMFGLFPDGSINYGAYKDPALEDRDARILTGNPAPGGTGPAIPTGLGNTTDSDVSRVAIVRGLAYADTPSRPNGNVRLSHVHVFDNISGQGFSSGRLRISEVVGFEASRYQIHFTPAFGTEEGTPLSTVAGNAYGRYGFAETFRYAAKDAFEILANWWKAQLGSGEQLALDVKGDGRPADYTVDAAERHEVAPYKNIHSIGGVPDRALPESAAWISTFYATTQQLYAASFNATYESSGRTFLPVGDSRDFRVGDACYVIGVVAGVKRIERGTIHALLAHDHATTAWRDCIVATTQLAYTYGVDAHVSTGPLIDTLGVRDRQAVLTRALAGQNYVDCTSALRADSGTIRLYNLATGDTEEHAYTKAVGQANRCMFGSGQTLGYTYEVGDEVVVKETDSWAPFFTRLRPEDGAEQEEQKAYIRAIRIATK